MHLPPGFDGMNLPLPRTTREAFASLLDVFFSYPFLREERVDILK
jgi:hypothetical protein